MRTIRPKSPPLLSLLAVIAALALVAGACGGGSKKATGGGASTSTTAAKEGTPVDGGTVTMGLEAETNNWVPFKGAWAQSGDNVGVAIFDPYLYRGSDGSLKPWLAESVTPNADLTEWTVKFRSGVKFQDGTDFNADAAKWNFDNLSNGPESLVKGVLAQFQVKSMTVVDPLTVKITLGQGNAAFPDALAGDIGFPFSPTAYQKDVANAGSHPVGTGPFSFVSWQKDSQLVVQKNPNYWQKGLPHLDKIIFRPIPDEDTRYQSLISGDINAMHSLRQSIVKQALDKAKEASSPIKVEEYIGNDGGGAIFNTKKPPVDDARVRQGLAWAMNQEALVTVLGGVDVAGIRNQWFNSNSKFYSAKVAKAWPNNNPTKAKDFLKQYMDDPNRSDKKPVGSPIAVEFNCPPDPSLIELAQLYQQEWTGVGVQVKLNQVEQAAHIQNAIKDDFMINCWRMGGDGDPYTTLSVAFGDPASQVLNFTNYTDDTIKTNVEKLRTSTDDATRKAAVEAIMMDFTTAVPNVWTGGTPTIVATNPKIHLTWKFPDGSKGGGQIGAVVNWSNVWMEK